MNFEKKHDFLLAVDSDGSAFDSTEIKHKECFIPNTIRYWYLQPIAKYARAAAEFVSLYSEWRGMNRFPALIKTFELLREWPEVQRRGAAIPEARPLREWIARETKLCNASLKAELEKTSDPLLARALRWSEAVNVSIADIVHDLPPFPLVRESLEAVSTWADILVCSTTPAEALHREWNEHDIAKYTTLIAGQEAGSKKEIIHQASAGRYEPSNILVIGDACGDLTAARANGARFYPIKPGGEEDSWQLFLCEAAEKFRTGKYKPEYEAKLVAEFQKLLPVTPPWKKQ